jgi:PAS domain S-box-containing protein
MEQRAAAREHLLLSGQARALELLARGRPLEDVLAELTRAIEEQAPGRRCSVLLVEGQPRRLRPAAAPSLPDSYRRALDGIEVDPAAGPCAAAAHSGRRVVVEDLAGDTPWSAYGAVARRHDLRACCSQPIVSDRGEVLGTFAMLYNEPGRPDADDLRRLETAARLAGVAIEHRRHEEALERSQRDHAKLVDSIDGIVWEADPTTFRFHFVSQQAERLLGYPVRRWLDEADFWAAHLHDEDRERAVEYCRRCSAAAVDHQLEYRMIAADGRSVWLHDAVTVVAENGQPARLRGVMVDVSRLKRFEDALRVVVRGTSAVTGGTFFRSLARHLAGEMQVRYALVAEALDPPRPTRCRALAFWTGDGFSDEFVYALAGTPCEKANAGEPSFFPDRLPQRFPEARIVVDLGAESYLGMPFYDPAGRLLGHLAVLDVAPMPDDPDRLSIFSIFALRAAAELERKRAEESARQAHERLLEHQRQEQQRVEAEVARLQDELVRKTRLATIGQVAASIAHDLRNPLSAIRNAAFYLRRRVPADEVKWAEHLGIIGEEVEEADRIITNLLEMGRARRPVGQRFDLEPSLRRVLAQASRSVTLRYRCEPEPFWICADPDMWRQVLANLVTNAVQAMDGGGAIEVEAQREPGFDVILLRDSGPGVPAAARSRLFEPLFTTKAKGTGLGLAICRQIVERHGGTIVLDETERPGAAFRIRLPRGEEG